MCFYSYNVLAYKQKGDIIRLGNKPILNFTQKLIMSTRSVIGIMNNDNSVDSVYCHFDGYPEHTGYFLKKFFDTTDKVKNLISNGDISSLVSSRNWERKEHPIINNKQVLKTLYYFDRPEVWESVKPKHHNSVLEFFERDCADEFKYLFLPSGDWNYKNKGVWKCYSTDDPTKPAPTVPIPDTSKFYDPEKHLFIYSFPKVSRVKELSKETKSLDTVESLGNKIMQMGL
tara:strand:+ start:191 stop:877 length:687 start_codon:yes stop_codon:yes gene_type:complete